MINKANRLLAVALAGAMALGLVAMPQMASAQRKQQERERNHRVGASVLGAAGLYMLSRKQTTLGAVALAGSAYEAKRMQDEINNRHRRARRNAYYRGYRSGRLYAANQARYRTGSSVRWVRDRNGHYHRVTTTTSRTRGTRWAATRGRKVGWYRNGKMVRSRTTTTRTWRH